MKRIAKLKAIGDGNVFIKNRHVGIQGEFETSGVIWKANVCCGKKFIHFDKQLSIKQ